MPSGPVVITDVTVPLEVDMTFIADVPTHKRHNFVIIIRTTKKYTYTIYVHMPTKRERAIQGVSAPEAVVVIPLSLEVSAVRSAELWLVGVGAEAGCEFGVVLGGGIGLPS